MKQPKPDQKALELINSVFKITQRYSEVKELSVLIVDEILKTNSFNAYSCGYLTLNVNHKEYWIEVINEIKKHCDES